MAFCLRWMYPPLYSEPCQAEAWKQQEKTGGGKEKEKSHLGTRFLYATSLSSAEVENLSALVLSFGTVRMGSFHSSVTVMRLSSSLIAACASSPQAHQLRVVIRSINLHQRFLSCDIALLCFSCRWSRPAHLHPGNCCKNLRRWNITSTASPRLIVATLKNTRAGYVISKQMNGRPPAGMWQTDGWMEGRLGRRDSRDARARTSIDTSALSDVPGARKHSFDSPSPSSFLISPQKRKVEIVRKSSCSSLSRRDKMFTGP